AAGTAEVLRSRGCEGAGAVPAQDPSTSQLKGDRLLHERLVALLTVLDQDIEILIRPKPRSREAARIRVEARDFERSAFNRARRRALTGLREGLDHSRTSSRDGSSTSETAEFRARESTQT